MTRKKLQNTGGQFSKLLQRTVRTSFMSPSCNVFSALPLLLLSVLETNETCNNNSLKVVTNVPECRQHEFFSVKALSLQLLSDFESLNVKSIFSFTLTMNDVSLNVSFFLL